LGAEIKWNRKLSGKKFRVDPLLGARKCFPFATGYFRKFKAKSVLVISKSLPGFPPPHQGSLEKMREENDPGQISKQIAEIRAGSLSRLPRSRAVISKCKPFCWLG